MNRNDFVSPKEKAKKIAYITLVIDESGSMGSVRDATLVGINEQIQQIQKDFKTDEIQALVSIIKFNQKVTPVFLHREIADVKELTAEDYVPGGNTAMYDAVGYAVEQLNSRKDIGDENTSSLVVVVSDGQENASSKHTARTIADSISKLNETKRWTFTYLGANQDLSQVSEATNIYAGNTLSFDSHSDSGVMRAFAMNASSMHRYSKSLMDTTEFNTVASTSFYAKAEEDEKEPVK